MKTFAQYLAEKHENCEAACDRSQREASEPIHGRSPQEINDDYFLELASMVEKATLLAEPTRKQIIDVIMQASASPKLSMRAQAEVKALAMLAAKTSDAQKDRATQTGLNAAEALDKELDAKIKTVKGLVKP